MARVARIGTWVWDGGELRRGTTRARLTALERSLISYLAARMGEVVGTDELLYNVWGYARAVHSRAVDNTVSRLRKKLGPDAACIQTVYRRGYCLVAPDDDELVGRDAVLEELRAALGRHGLVNLHGPGGVGKSRVARVVAAQAPQCLWLDASAVSSVEELTGWLAQHLDKVGPTPTADDLWEGLKASGALLLVVDAAEHLDGAVVQHISRWCSHVPMLSILLTSRQLFADEPAVRVPPLDRASSIVLLQRRAAVHDVVPSHDHAQALVQRLDGLPLAIELAAARLRFLGPEELVERLQDGIEVLDGPEDRLGASLDASFQALDAEQQRLLCAASLFPGSFGARDVEKAAGMGATQALNALEGLVRRALLTRQGRSFRLLDLVRAFARGRADTATEKGFATWAASEARALYERHYRGEEVAADALQLAAPIVVAALACGPDPSEQAWLILALHRHDAVHGPLRRARALLDDLDLDPLAPALRAEVLSERSNICFASDERDLGLRLIEQAMHVVRALPDREQTARLWSRHVNSVRMVRSPAEALEMATQLVSFVETHPVGAFARGQAYYSLGHCLTPLGRYGEAHRLYLRALPLLSSRAESEVEVRARIGFVQFMLGRHAASLAEVQRAYDLAEQCGLARAQVSAARYVADFTASLRDAEASSRAYQRLLEVSSSIHDTAGLFLARIGLARFDPEVEEGCARLQELREHALLVGRVREASEASLWLGHRRHLDGRLDLAVAAYHEAIEIVAPIGWAIRLTRCRSFLAMALAEQGLVSEAGAQLDLAEPGSAMGRQIHALARAAVDRDLPAFEQLCSDPTVSVIGPTVQLAERLVR